MKHSKNIYRFDGDICIGADSKGREFIFDSCFYDKIKEYCWYVSANGYVASHYYRSDGKRTALYMHRLLFDMDEYDAAHPIDHINHNGTDNRMSNLRICTTQENGMNRKASKNNKIGVKGVHKTSCGKFRAQIKYNQKMITIGEYPTIKEASDAYDKMAKLLFGEFANLNNYEENKNE